MNRCREFFGEMIVAIFVARRQLKLAASQRNSRGASGATDQPGLGRYRELRIRAADFRHSGSYAQPDSDPSPGSYRHDSRR
jgi:hypothetical protein